MNFPIKKHQLNYTRWIFIYLCQPNEGGQGNSYCPYTAGWNWFKTKLNAEYGVWRNQKFKTSKSYISLQQRWKNNRQGIQLVLTTGPFLTNTNTKMEGHKVQASFLYSENEESVLYETHFTQLCMFNTNCAL